MNVPTTLSHTQADESFKKKKKKKGDVEKRDNDLTKERRGDVQEKEPGQEKCSDTLKIYSYKGREKYYSIFVDISTLPGSVV